MDINKLKAKRDFWERALSSSDQFSIGNFLDETFHGLLKEHIYQLHSRHHQRNNENFDSDYLLHEEIVRLFNDLNVGYFSLFELEKFRAWENTLCLKGRLECKKLIEADVGGKIKLLEAHIKKIKPLIGSEKVDLYLNSNLPVRVEDVEDILCLSDAAPENEVYQNFFSAAITKDKKLVELVETRKERASLERQYTPLDSYESNGLKEFKHDRHPKYSSSSYAARFVNWRLRELGRLMRGE